MAIADGPHRRPGLRLGLIGGWTLHADGRAVAVPHSVQRLLAFVALRDLTPRSVVAGRLWPDCPDARSQGNLRSAIWRAHRIATNLLIEEAGQLSLGADIEVDIRMLLADDQRFVRFISSVALDQLSEGELLPGWYEEWVLAEREIVRQKWLHSLEEHARRLASEARYADALMAALAAVRAEPLRESAHRVLIEVHIAEGNVAEAQRSYQLLRRLLKQELGLEPSLLCRSALWAPLPV